MDLIDDPSVDLLPYVRCVTCGKPVGEYHDRYFRYLKRGGNAEDFFNYVATLDIDEATFDKIDVSRDYTEAIFKLRDLQESTASRISSMEREMAARIKADPSSKLKEMADYRRDTAVVWKEAQQEADRLRRETGDMLKGNRSAIKRACCRQAISKPRITKLGGAYFNIDIATGKEPLVKVKEEGGAPPPDQIAKMVSETVAVQEAQEPPKVKKTLKRVSRAGAAGRASSQSLINQRKKGISALRYLPTVGNIEVDDGEGVQGKTAVTSVQVSQMSDPKRPARREPGSFVGSIVEPAGPNSGRFIERRDKSKKGQVWTTSDPRTGGYARPIKDITVKRKRSDAKEVREIDPDAKEVREIDRETLDTIKKMEDLHILEHMAGTYFDGGFVSQKDLRDVGMGYSVHVIDHYYLAQ